MFDIIAAMHISNNAIGKNGAHSLAVFSKTITVNLVGSFNMIRLASDAMSKNEPATKSEKKTMEA